MAHRVSLRNRLFVALVAFAVLPTAVLSLVALDLVSRTTARWYQPGVAGALADAVDVSRTALTRVEANALARADDWAASLGPLPLDPPRRTALRDELRRAGLDFLHVYWIEGGRWRPIERIAPEGVLAADDLDLGPEIAPALAGNHLLRSRRGVLAAVSRTEGGIAIATGIRLTPDYFAALDRVERARDLYRRVGIFAEFEQRGSWVLVLGLVTILTLAAFLVARAQSRGLTRPIATLREGFERVARGELATRVTPEGASELRSLADSFNTMTARLVEARDAAQRAEREAAWREVARRLAHEIKNPLTPMRLSLHRLQRRVDIVPEHERAAVRDALTALLHEVEHLTRLAEQFAQYARLPEPRLESFDLVEMARSAVALHEPLEGRLTLRSQGPVPVRGDRLLLSRALHNLLLNAIEAGPEGAPIEVAAGTTGTRGWIEVLDRGSGLPPELAARVFEPYVSTKHRGSGLGLSLVRDIAEQHGGLVALENREGGGARARIELPLADRPADSPRE